jgi:hypothetical protein
MVALTCAASGALRAVDPNVRVISPAPTDQLDGVAWLDEFLEKGGGRCVDAIGFHFYVLAHEPPEAIVPLVRAVKAALAKHGLGSKPIWDTEFGWYVKNEHAANPSPFHALTGAEIGDYLARSWILQASFNVQRAFEYSWNHKAMGLVEPDTGQAKPGVSALADIAAAMRGANIQPCAAQADVWTCPAVLSSGEAGSFRWSTRGSGQTPRFVPALR